jgi:glycosyltransferase involved in cell wall biosynthesis
MSKKLMSIIMLNWNRKHYSEQTLNRIVEATTIPHELILVDNGSEDGTREYLKGMENKTNAEKVTYVFNDKNLGVAGGRNSGLVVASGGYLVTIDDDILVPDRWDVLMAEACDKIPGLGITGVNVEPINFPIKKVNGVKVRPKQGNLGGACLCLPRRVFKRVGYYNYSSKDGGNLYGHEDSLMYYRLGHLGLISAYIVPHGVHLDTDQDKAYRAAKNEAHKKGSIQLNCMSAYLKKMRKTGDVYVSFDPDYEPPDKDIFTNKLIVGDRDGKTKNNT